MIHFDPIVIMVSILPKLKYRFNAISKCQQLFCNTDKLIWKHTGSRMAEIILEEKNKVEELTWLDFKINYKSTIIKAFVMASVQFSSVTQSCPTLCDPMNRSMPGLPVHHQLPEFIETHVHQVSDALQPSHPLSSPSPLAANPSQHQSLFQWVNSSHEVAKVLEFQL